MATYMYCVYCQPQLLHIYIVLHVCQLTVSCHVSLDVISLVVCFHNKSTDI